MIKMHSGILPYCRLFDGYTQLLCQIYSHSPDQMKQRKLFNIYLPNEFPGLCASVEYIATLLPDMLYDYYEASDTPGYHPRRTGWIVSEEKTRTGEKHLWDFGFQFGDHLL